MTGAARTSSVRGIPEIRNGHWLGRTVFAVVLAEFSLALAAARRYEDLRYGNGRHEGMAPADIPRRVFEEFYAYERPCGGARPPDGILRSRGTDRVCAATLIRRSTHELCP